GHVMVVHGAVRAGDRELLVPIADSTAHGTHADDSRGADAGGLGTGTIGLVVDAAGAPQAYHWAGGVSKKAVATTIVLGRLRGSGGGLLHRVLDVVARAEVRHVRVDLGFAPEPDARPPRELVARDEERPEPVAVGGRGGGGLGLLARAGALGLEPLEQLAAEL